MKNTKKFALSLLLATFGILATSSLSVHAQIADGEEREGIQEEKNIRRQVITPEMKSAAIESINSITSQPSFAAFVKEHYPNVDFLTNNARAQSALGALMFEMASGYRQMLSGVPANIYNNDLDIAVIDAQIGEDSTPIVQLAEVAKLNELTPADYARFKFKLETWFNNTKSIAIKLRNRHNM